MPDAWFLSHDRTPNPDPGSSGYSGILQEFHVPWPACNQDAARQAADAWSALADGIDDINTECNNLVASITTNNSGQAIDAFGAYWQKYGGKTGALTLSSEACRALAKTCNDLADRVSAVKTQIEHKAEELLVVVAAAAVALIFTWGASVAVSAEVAGQVAAWVTGLIDDLATSIGYASEQLGEEVGFLAAPVGSVSGATLGALSGSAIAGTFAGLFDEEFSATLKAVNGEALPSAGESVADLVKEFDTTELLGVLTEVTPVVAEEATSVEITEQVFTISPELSAMLTDSSKLAAWLDTPAGKAFVAGGGIVALRSSGWLDESGTEGKVVESMLEAALAQINPPEE